MAGARRNWEFWTFWLTLSAGLIIAGGALQSAEYPVVSKALILAVSKVLIVGGIVVLGLSILSLALAPFTDLLTPLTNRLAVVPALFFRGLYVILTTGASFVFRAYVAVGGFVLGPIIEHTLPHQREAKPNDAFVVIHVKINFKTPRTFDQWFSSCGS